MDFKTLKNTSKNILSDIDKDKDTRLQQICQLLYDHIDYYNWVGIYFADHQSHTLYLGPYVGEATEHTKIPFGKGICGQVAVSNKNFIVQDVMAQDNYIACSIAVKSEIVVPIFVDNKNIGQIDIDSHRKNAFDKKDENFLEFITSEIAKLFN